VCPIAQTDLRKTALSMNILSIPFYQEREVLQDVLSVAIFYSNDNREFTSIVS
jgi:hypothetical protein